MVQASQVEGFGAKSPDDDKPHAEILSAEALKNSGKDDNILHAGLKSVAPASGKKANWSKDEDYKILSDVSLLFEDDGDEKYPFGELEIDQGFFVAVKPNETTDQVLAKMHKSVEAAKKRYGEPEVNEDGDRILEVVTIETRKRNEDGTVRLNGNQPILGADFHQRPKYVYTRNFVVKAVIADQEIGENVKAEGDGVVVIRVA